jgi:hypothetical protein
MSIVAAICLLLFNLMSERRIISSRSRVTPRIFFEVFLHIVEIFSDCTFWERNEIRGKRGMVTFSSTLGIAYSEMMILNLQYNYIVATNKINYYYISSKIKEPTLKFKNQKRFLFRPR